MKLPLVSAWLVGALGVFLVPLQGRVKEAFDGFEENTLSPAWALDRCLPGSVTLQHEVVRAGKGAVRIQVNEGDLAEGVGPMQSKETERAELREADRLVGAEGEAASYAFSIYLPKDFPVVPTRLVLAQWKQRDTNGAATVDSPVVALRYANGELSITLQTAPEKKVLYRTTEVIRGRWMDFEFQARFSRESTGFLRVIRDGKTIVNYSGPTAYAEAYGYPPKGQFYFKMGLYRDRMAQPMFAYFDEYRRHPLP